MGQVEVAQAIARAMNMKANRRPTALYLAYSCMKHPDDGGETLIGIRTTAKKAEKLILEKLEEGMKFTEKKFPKPKKRPAKDEQVVIYHLTPYGSGTEFLADFYYVAKLQLRKDD